jgi:two-component system, cell cycle response regulator
MLEARCHDALPIADELEALALIKADISIDALITTAELKHMSGVELCWETRLLVARFALPPYVFFFCSARRGMISMNEQGRWRLSS